MSENTITELVCTRMSHDIIGNIGAVANAVELLEEGDMDFIDDIKSILKVSSKVLAARLKFFRLTFGLSNSNLTDMPTVQKTVEEYVQTIGNSSYPISVTMNIQNVSWTRYALLLVMILADVLIKGGKITVKEQGEELLAQVYSEYPLAVEKIKNIGMVLSGSYPENAAQYAPIVYLQNLLNNEKKINMMTGETFGFIIR